MDRRSSLPVFLLLIAISGARSCGSSANPYVGRVLTGIAVASPAADAQSFPNGQVNFTATGTFSLPPPPAPVMFTCPYTGQLVVSNPGSSSIATIVASGSGTITVACTAGASGTVEIGASAAANKGTTSAISGTAPS